MDSAQFKLQLDEIYSANDRSEALNLSGLMLAKADEALRQKVNAKAERSDECRMFCMAATIHAELLQACSQTPMAYSTALTSMLLLDIAGQGSEDSRMAEVCGLTFIALSAFGELAAQMPHDEFTEQHVPQIFSMLASRLYHYYQNCDKSDFALPHLIRGSHNVLSHMIDEGIVQYPTVMIGDQAAGPQSSAVLADLIGRSQALGILNLEF